MRSIILPKITLAIGAAAVLAALSGMLAKAAIASGPPTATTGAPSAVGGATATFTGTLNGADEPTSYRFEYKRTEEGQETPVDTSEQQAQISPEDQQVTGTPDYLVPGSTYEVRSVATNADGIAYGKWVQFTTKSAPPKGEPPPPGMRETFTPPGGSDKGQGDPQSASRSRAQCVVPRLTGATLAASRHKLAAADCKVGHVRYARSSHVHKGRVVAQGKRAGTKMAAGAKVSITVSRGQ